MQREGERRFHDSEEDMRFIVDHFKQFVQHIHPEKYPEEHAMQWKEMIGKMFRNPTPEEEADASRWKGWSAETLAKDITPELLQAYHEGTVGKMRTRFVRLALSRVDVDLFTTSWPEYMQAVLGYEFPYELLGENYPAPPEPPLAP